VGPRKIKYLLVTFTRQRVSLKKEKKKNQFTTFLGDFADEELAPKSF
jgi:hypothetical protein